MAGFLKCVCTSDKKKAEKEVSNLQALRIQISYDQFVCCDFRVATNKFNEELGVFIVKSFHPHYDPEFRLVFFPFNILRH